MWETSSGKKLRTFPNTYVTAFSGNGKLLVTGYTEVIVWDVFTGRKLRTIPLDGVQPLSVRSHRATFVGSCENAIAAHNFQPKSLRLSLDRTPYEEIRRIVVCRPHSR